MGMLSFLLLGFIFESLCLLQVFGDISEKRYSRSVVNLVDLLRTDYDLALNLEKYASLLSKKAKLIRRGIHQMQEMDQKDKSESTNIWDSPFNAFSLIRHMQADWLMWLHYLEKPVGQEEVAYLEGKIPDLPHEVDFEDAAEGMRRMQGTYELLSSDMAKGLLDGVQYNSSLAAVDCLAIGQHLINNMRWKAAEQWIISGFEAHAREVPQTEMQLLKGPIKSELYKKLGDLRVQEGKPEKALEAYQTALRYSLHDVELYHQYQNLEDQIHTLSVAEPIEELDDEYEQMHLPPCCSGRCKVPRHLRKLYCVYNHVTNPFLRLAPIKTEILSVDPFVIILHDMVSKKESTLLRSISKEALEPSETVNAENKKYMVDRNRLSKSVWFETNKTEVTKILSKRLGDATGLDMNRSEPFQVINYGIGGFFGSHWDALYLNEHRFGVGIIDRIATSLFYLTDVPQGGGTYFPGLNITVFPRAGTVLFWYNFDMTGDEHLRSMHTGCPVIVGSKWVVSKWIEDKGQEFRRPCVNSGSNTKYLLSVEKLLI
ncbi:prolyl 4-hydroxylase subunit alpha-1-like isoform X1 [Drosophila rhopaloa]|uniref:procollagen-proline 4-dioxygenase n=1 Tax=Drosophila rhopaloa TaxID=1041015 RepID=A0ABM5HI36_DRORH|nr:prolyl 4-hydroxylase subunit alpha-1-like isoform X1 [Drosophila rhopaloa]